MAGARIPIDDLPPQTTPNVGDLVVVQTPTSTNKMLISDLSTSITANRVINGGGASTIMVLTQAAYDALTPKSPTTLYFING